MRTCQPAKWFLVCLGIVMFCSSDASAQLAPAVDYSLSPTGANVSPGSDQQAVKPALFTGVPGGAMLAGGPGEYMNAHGEPIVLPASYCASCDSGCYSGDCYDGGAYGYGDAALAGLGGGFGPDQCGPHFFDISAEFLYWKRDKASDPDVPFASVGINGPRILSSHDLPMNEEPGFKIIGRYDLGPMSVFEATYFGTFHYANSVGVTRDNPDLFSPFSNFGLGNPPAFQGFTEADAVCCVFMGFCSVLSCDKQVIARKLNHNILFFVFLH